MFVVYDLCLGIANWNERVKCHWGELFTQFLFCSKFVLHSSVIFILLVSSVSLYIYLLKLWLRNVNTIQDRKFSLLSLFRFEKVFCFFVYTLTNHSLTPCPITNETIIIPVYNRVLYRVMQKQSLCIPCFTLFFSSSNTFLLLSS